MTKDIGILKIACFFLILCILTLPILQSCSIANQPDFDVYGTEFVAHFFKKNKVDSTHISGLTAYYEEECYYYAVTYTLDGDDFVYELLYVLKTGQLDTFFSIKNPEECYQYFPEKYNNFLEAQKSGEKKEYSPEEIQNIIDAYYSKSEETK